MEREVESDILALGVSVIDAVRVGVNDAGFVGVRDCVCVFDCDREVERDTLGVILLLPELEADAV